MKYGKLIGISLLLASIPFGMSGQMAKSGTLKMVPGFSRFAKDYVEERINRWQQKGEFEKTDDYRQRIETQRDVKIKEYTEEAKIKYVQDHRPADLKAELTLGGYNADAEVYVISHPEFGDFVLPISIDEAPDFKKYWYQLTPNGSYIIENDRVALVNVQFKQLRGKTKRAYECARTNAEEFADVEIDFKFDPIEINPENPVDMTHAERNSRGNNVGKKVAQADIDLNIPVGIKTSNSNTFAVIIANENYRRVSPVEYAHNDGNIMKRYLIETLGIPEKQVHYVKDATLNDMRAEIEWIKEIGDAYAGQASFIFYYAGHGIPDEATSNGYLLPTDGYGSMSSTGLSMNELNDRISSIPSRLSLVILDACFSGAMRGGEMLASARGVAIKVRPGAVNRGNIVVLTASQEDETASKCDEYGHGLFTYYLLKKIQGSKGSVTLGELADYTIDQVRRYSIVNNRKPQTPSALASPLIQDNWSSVILSEMTK